MLGPVNRSAEYTMQDDGSDDATSDGGNSDGGAEDEKPTTLEDNIIAKLTAFKNDGMSRKEAVQMVVGLLNVPRNPVYKIALTMSWDKK